MSQKPDLEKPLEVDQLIRDERHSYKGVVLVVASVALIMAFLVMQQSQEKSRIAEAARQEQMEREQAEQRAREEAAAQLRLKNQSVTPSQTVLRIQSQSAPDWQYGHRGGEPENFEVVVSDVSIAFTQYTGGLLESQTTRQPRVCLFRDLSEVSKKHLNHRRSHEKQYGLRRDGIMSSHLSEIDSFNLLIRCGRSSTIFFESESDQLRLYQTLNSALSEWRARYGHL